MSLRVRVLPLLVIVAAVLVAVARIAVVEGAFSDNDRSRWATVRALADNHTFAIGSRAIEGGVAVDRGIVAEPGWTSVDVVLDPDTGLFYSSKPPLLAYLASLPTRACAALGFTLAGDRPVVTRVVLVIFNLLPLLLALLAVRRMLPKDDPLATSLALATLGAGSLFSTFVVTLNPHLIAGAAAAVALLAALRERPSAGHLALAGLAAGTAAAFEPTALAFLVLVAFAVARAGHAGRALLFFAPGAALPLFLHLVTTAFVFGDALHFVGPRKAWFQFAGSYWLQPSGVDAGDSSVLGYVFHLLVGHHGLFSITPALALGAAGLALTVLPARKALLLLLLAVASFIAGRALESVANVHWLTALLAPAVVATALVVVALRSRPQALADPGAPAIDTDETTFAHERAVVVLASTILSLGFYTEATSSFGGVALGPRWLLWLVPLLVLGVPRALAALPRSSRVPVASAALAIGVLLATPRGLLNPWQHPRLSASAEP